jgi:hypothetical protein
MRSMRVFCSLFVAFADEILAVNMMSRLIAVLLAAAALTSCASVDFSPYVGAQQNWPVASGSFVQRKFDLPVYFGPPDRPYIVLGYMDTQSAPLAIWESGKDESIKPAVKEAAKRGADAIILLGNETSSRGTITSSSQTWGSNTQFNGGVYGNNFYGNANTTGNAFGSSFSSNIRVGYARAIAIKFLKS